MHTILIIEDEPNLAEGLKFNLEIEGFSVTTFPTAEEALPVFQDYHMMILDIMLPGMNGIELLKRIREVDAKYPVLIVSAKIAEIDLLEGLSAGADDYITKPFSLPELILRVRRILERQAWYTEATRKERIYRFGNYSINFDTLEAQSNKGIMRLTPHESYIMKYLIENKDRTISREELLVKVWGYSKETETRTVDAFVARLRKLFEEERKTVKHIVSIRGVGYRFYD